jgi:hypothetical protein
LTTEQTPPAAPRPGRRVFTVEELSTLVPGLGTIMPDIGIRTWKLYYAAKAGNWTLANFQVNEIRGLMMRGAFTRPNYESDLKSYVDETWTKVKDAVAKKDFAEFDTVFQAAIKEANEYHDGSNHAYIQWKLPDSPPPDLDLTPRD